jgi:methylated-DNA-protein-cysteine methyltransferase related protein
MCEVSFYGRVYRLVAQIPSGRVATYGQIAAMLGQPKSARQVGDAMRKTPPYLDIPTHRVIHATGRLAPAAAFGGAGQQRARLEREGVLFTEDGRADLTRCRW